MYDKNGNEINVLQKLKTGEYVGQIMMTDQYGMNSPSEEKKVFTELSTTRKRPSLQHEIESLQSEKKVLKAQLGRLEQNIVNTEKYNESFVNALKEIESKFNSDTLSQLIKFLSGGIRYVIFNNQNYVRPISDLYDDYGRLYALTLFGKRNGDLNFGITTYYEENSDDLCNSKEAQFFETEQEAKDFLYDKNVAIINDIINPETDTAYSYHAFDQALRSISKLGYDVIPEWKQYHISKQIKAKKALIEERKNSLALEESLLKKLEEQYES